MGQDCAVPDELMVSIGSNSTNSKSFKLLATRFPLAAIDRPFLFCALDNTLVLDDLQESFLRIVRITRSTVLAILSSQHAPSNAVDDDDTVFVEETAFETSAGASCILTESNIRLHCRRPTVPFLYHRAEPGTKRTSPSWHRDEPFRPSVRWSIRPPIVHR